MSADAEHNTAEGPVASAVRAGRERNGLAFVPFVAGGFPDLSTCRAVLSALGRAGADVIEVGFPFSDPIADGGTIQAAFGDALAAGCTVDALLDLVASLRGQLDVPLVAMTSFSIIWRVGPETFCRRIKAAGFAGVLAPDLPADEAGTFVEIAHAAGLETVLLIAPTTPVQKQPTIARLASGFVYYVSVAGTTGERDALPSDLPERLARLRESANRPICVGFGISKPEHLSGLTGAADGAIVGSALVREVRRAAEASDDPASVGAAIEKWVADLRSRTSESSSDR